MKGKLRRYSLILLFSVIAYILLMEINFLWLFGYSPTIAEIRNPRVSIASEVYTADGKLIGKFYRQNRTPVAYKDISPLLIKTLVATEDAHFFMHFGIDVGAIVSGIFSTATGDQRGASTITQQLVKNMYSTRRHSSQGLLSKIPLIRTIVFKTKEWINAVKVETFYSKEEILEMYLNTVGFGNNTFGIHTAAKIYFNTTPDKLTINQCAVLVGLLKGTTIYNPISHPENALARRNVVLGQLVKYDVISENAFEELKKQPLSLDLSARYNGDEQESYIRMAVKNWLDDWCKENDYDIYEDGLKIYTTIDSRLQDYAQEAVNDRMAWLQRRFNSYWGKSEPWTDEQGQVIPNYLEKLARKTEAYKVALTKYSTADSAYASLSVPKRMKVFSWKGGECDTTFSSMDSLRYYLTLLQTGMLTIDPFNGHIKVWIGGIDSKYFKFDHVKQSKRQPGSTFKPFAYLTALEQGYSPCDTFTDKPVTIHYTEKGEEKSWSPQNADFKFTGWRMTMRWGMGRSCNSVTAQVTQKVGWDNVVKTAQKLGITSPLESVPSICLGPSDVSLFEMVRAYSTFLNTGIKSEPVLVTHITDREGKSLAEFKSEQKRVIDEETAWLMLYMFKGGIEEPFGTSQALWEYDLFKDRNEIGGKTGTSSNYVDGWYIGISKDLITGVWTGCDDRNVHFKTSATGEGSKTALPIYGKFMEMVYKDPKTGITLGKFPKPTVKINRNYYCPNATPKIDTLNTDSLSSDSVTIDMDGTKVLIK